MGTKYRAADIAAWLIKRDDKEKDKKEKISTLKLMKLLYYCYGAFLAIDEIELFSEKIRAWEYGPAVEEVYNVFKGIPPYEITEHVELLDGQPIDSYDEELLEQVYQELGYFTAIELTIKTHREEPWLKATNYGKLLRNKIIDTKIIKEYFEKYYTEAA